MRPEFHRWEGGVHELSRPDRVGAQDPRATKETAVPLIEVKLYDHRVTEESVPKMIEALTDALHESSGAAKDHIWVVVEGVSPKRWGIGGRPGA